jgi:hypothetical protein
MPVPTPVLAALLLISTATATIAQSPTDSTRREAARACPCGRFSFRMPRLPAMRAMPGLRMDLGRIRMNAMDRAFERMDRMRGRQFAMQDRFSQRRMELRSRAFDHLRERMDRRPMAWGMMHGRRYRRI